MNVDGNDSFEKAYELWNDFKQEVLYKNRFILKHQVLEFLKQNAQKITIEVEETILYRARIYNEDDNFLRRYLYGEPSNNGMDTPVQKLSTAKYEYDIGAKQESGLWGFNSKDSFVPPNNDVIKGGRANPAFIKYLYTAEDPYTALVEARPYLGSKVSVAEIKVNESLKIADFSQRSIDKFEGFEANLIYLIMLDFSRPSDANQKDYIPTQYVAEFIKTLEFDGIKFNSSLNESGRNITIFNYKKCNPLGSKLYEVEDICLEASGLAPRNEKHLIHFKLEAHKEKCMRKLSLGLKR